jgi:BT1 family
MVNQADAHENGSAPSPSALRASNHSKPHRVEDKEIEMQPLTSSESSYEDIDRVEKLLDPIEIEVQVEAKPWNLEDWLFPPHLPRSCQLLRPENIAIPACYLLVGILQGLSGPLINAYPLELGATEAQQTTLSGIKSLPASFKLLFGFLSDNVPLGGYRRKSYMIIGWGLAALSMVALMFSDLSMGKETYVKDDGSTAVRAVPPEDAPSIRLLSFSFLLFGIGTCIWFRSASFHFLLLSSHHEAQCPGHSSILSPGCYLTELISPVNRILDGRCHGRFGRG